MSADRSPEVEATQRELRITCADAIERMTDWLEDVLVDGDRQRLDDHLAGCQACGVYLDQVRSTVTIVGSLREDEQWQLDAKAMDGLLARFRDATADGN